MLPIYSQILPHSWYLCSVCGLLPGQLLRKWALDGIEQVISKTFFYWENINYISYYYAEVIGALTSVVMIWVVTGVLVFLAIQRLIDRDVIIDANVMLITSAIGVAFNLIMGCTLHQHGHSHGGIGHNHSHSAHSHSTETQTLLSHSHSSHHTEDDVENINVRAAFIHVVGDFVQSLGVFIAALVIYFKVFFLWFGFT